MVMLVKLQEAKVKIARMMQIKIRKSRRRFTRRRFNATHLASEKANVWYHDTGCSNDMIDNKNWFVKSDESVRRSICFHHNSMATSEGMHTVVAIYSASRASSNPQNFRATAVSLYLYTRICIQIMIDE